VLNAAGLKSGQYTADTSRAQPALAALKAGTLDAVVMVGRVPFPRLTEATSGMPLRLLPIDSKTRQRLVRAVAALQPVTLPAASYIGQENPVETVAVPVLLLVREDMADTAAQAIVRVLSRPENIKKLGAEDAPTLSVAVGVPLHRGISAP
ncbi:MAG: TAXI family TRAP transporter solute-binding subunit, partial [Holosporales bacterium]